MPALGAVLVALGSWGAWGVLASQLWWAKAEVWYAECSFSYSIYQSTQKRDSFNCVCSQLISCQLRCNFLLFCWKAAFVSCTIVLKRSCVFVMVSPWQRSASISHLFLISKKLFTQTALFLLYTFLTGVLNSTTWRNKYNMKKLLTFCGNTEFFVKSNFWGLS